MSKICKSISCDILLILSDIIWRKKLRTFRWMTFGLMRLAMFQFETKLQKCIRMGITIYKIFIWGGISSDIHSEITFTASLTQRRKTKFPTVYPTIYLPKWKFWIQLYPNFTPLFMFILTYELKLTLSLYEGGASDSVGAGSGVGSCVPWPVWPVLYRSNLSYRKNTLFKSSFTRNNSSVKIRF